MFDLVWYEGTRSSRLGFLGCFWGGLVLEEKKLHVGWMNGWEVDGTFEVEMVDGWWMVNVSQV